MQRIFVNIYKGPWGLNLELLLTNTSYAFFFLNKSPDQIHIVNGSGMERIIVGTFVSNISCPLNKIIHVLSIYQIHFYPSPLKFHCIRKLGLKSRTSWSKSGLEAHEISRVCLLRSCSYWFRDFWTQNKNYLPSTYPTSSFLIETRIR
jgi:hypothetical protein